MNRKLILWAGVLALAAGPALNLAAQEGPGDNEEVEMMGVPGQPDTAQGMGKGMKGGMGQGRLMIKSKRIMRGRPGRDEGQGGDMGGPGFLSEDETLAVIKKNDPAFAKKVEDLKTIAPAKYKMVLRMSGKLFAVAKMEQDESIEKDAVRALALEFESKELSLKYDKASDAEKKAIKETLRGKLAELFDLKARGQELRVKRMEGEMARLKKNLASRKDNKSKIVEQRLEQLTGEGHGW